MEFIKLTAMGSRNSQLLNHICALAEKNKCNIETARMTLLGNDPAVVMLIRGTWHGIARLETGIKNLCKQKEFTYLIDRVKPEKPKSDLLPYTSQIIALDQHGILDEICEFFSKQEVLITDLHATTYPTSQSKNPMAFININVAIPADINISNLREQFMMLCEAMNIDGILEPERR